MKSLFIFLSFLLTLSVSAQVVNCGSLFNATLKAQNDITARAGAPLTVRSSGIEATTGKIRFEDATVILDGATITCDELEFGPAVTQVQCANKVKIDCRRVLVDAATPGVVWRTLSAANLTITTRTAFPANPKMTIEWGPQFYITLAKRP